MTIAVRPQQTRYVPLSEKEQREAAIKLASTANGDTERLLLTPEERAKRQTDAEQIANKAVRNLSPQQVWDETVLKVSFMTAEAAHGLGQVFPDQVQRCYRPVPNKERKILASKESPHAGLGLIAIIDAGRGREIALYGGNTGGTVYIENGIPKIEVNPSDEKTQNDPRYFGIAQQRLANGKRDPSKQPLFMDMTDINDVAKRCCELLGAPAPTKTYKTVKERKVAEAAAKATAPSMKPQAVRQPATKPVPTHQVHARSLWASPHYEPTIGEMRQLAVAYAVKQQEPARAFAM